MGTKPEEFDVCVIGTGAGGGVMIQELTAAGFRVVALQRGPFLQPSQFDDDELRTVIRDEVFSPDQVETYHIENAKLDEMARDALWTSCTMILPLRERGSPGSPLRPVAIGVPGR